MKRLLSIFTISALIAFPAFSQETKLKKLEKLEKTEKSEKAVVIDSTIVKDTVVVELGDEVFSVKEIGDETKMKAKDFKSGKRVWLTEQGYDIVGTVGDQWSDLEGEYHGIQIKIPNYLYLIED